MAKGPNKRIYIELIEDSEGTRVFGITLRSLVDAKTRDIVEKKLLMTPTIFSALVELGNVMIHTDELRDFVKAEVENELKGHRWQVGTTLEELDSSPESEVSPEYC